MKSLRTTVAVAAAGITLAVATASFAQPFGGPGPGFGPGAGHGPLSATERQALMDAHFTQLKTQLGITSGQEAAWQAFVSQAQAQAQSMGALRAQMRSSTATSAPERMAQHTQIMEQRLDGMTAMTNALNGLYAVLTPAQKAIADENFARMGPRGPHFGRGR